MNWISILMCVNMCCDNIIHSKQFCITEQINEKQLHPYEIKICYILTMLNVNIFKQCRKWTFFTLSKKPILSYEIVQITHMDTICAPYILKRALYIIKYTIVHNFLVHNLPTWNFVLPVSKFLTGSDRRRWPKEIVETNLIPLAWVNIRFYILCSL